MSLEKHAAQLTPSSPNARAAFRFCLGLALAAACFAQSAPEFEVASVKLAPPMDIAAMAQGKGLPGVRMDAGRLEIANLGLREVVMAAYGVKQYQLACPDWLKTVRVNIVAKLPEGSSQKQIPEMLQKLLAERFALVMHKEPRDLPVYGLMVGKNGAKLKDSVPDPDNPPTETKDEKPSGLEMLSRLANVKMSGDPRKGLTVSGLPQGGKIQVTLGSGGIHMESSALTMEALSEQLGQYMDRPVLDQTGLKGTYQVGLDISMEDIRAMMSKMNLPVGAMPAGGPNAGGAAAEPSGTSILESVGKLGLKIEKVKSKMDFVVVDSMAKTPVEN